VLREHGNANLLALMFAQHMDVGEAGRGAVRRVRVKGLLPGRVILAFMNDRQVVRHLGSPGVCGRAGGF
jgi:hypothetical protein